MPSPQEWREELDEEPAASKLAEVLDGRTQIVLHRTVPPDPSFTVKITQNSRSLNAELGVHGARSVEEAVSKMAELKKAVEERFEIVIGGGSAPKPIDGL